MSPTTDIQSLTRSAACYLRDEYVFPVFQAGVLFIFLYAVWKDLRLVARLRKRFFPHHGLSADPQAVRGPQSREYFHLAYALASVVVLQFVNASKTWEAHKTIVGLADLGILLYLTYFNGWMRNRIIGFVARWQRRPD